MDSKEAVNKYFEDIKVVEVIKEFPGLNFGDSLEFNEETSLFELREKYEDNRSVKINRETIRQYFNEYFKDITEDVELSNHAKSTSEKINDLEKDLARLKRRNALLEDFIFSKNIYLENEWFNYDNNITIPSIWSQRR